MSTSSFTAGVPADLGWWSLFLAVGRASHMAVAAAYLVVFAHFVRACGRSKDVQSFSDIIRHFSVLLCFSALAHAADAFASFHSQSRLFTTPALLAAAFASAAVVRMPRPPRDGSPPPEPRPARDASPAESPSRRFERLEELVRRNDWLLRRNQDVRDLDALLGSAAPQPAPGQEAGPCENLPGGDVAGPSDVRGVP